MSKAKIMTYVLQKLNDDSYLSYYSTVIWRTIVRIIYKRIKERARSREQKLGRYKWISEVINEKVTLVWTSYVFRLSRSYYTQALPYHHHSSVITDVTFASRNRVAKAPQNWQHAVPCRNIFASTLKQLNY